MLLYNLSRPFYPGIRRPQSCKEVDKRHIQELASEEGIETKADASVKYLFTVFDRQAIKHPQIAADAYMALLEMPRLIFPLEATLRHLERAGGDDTYVFRWLASLPERVTDGLYTDYALSIWSAIHVFPEIKSVQSVPAQRSYSPHVQRLLRTAMANVYHFPPHLPVVACFDQVLRSRKVETDFIQLASKATRSGGEDVAALDEQLRQLTLKVVESKTRR